jgi:hypothetical protein
MRPTLFVTVAFAATLIAPLAGCETAREPAGGPAMPLVNASGQAIGTVRAWQTAGGVSFRIEATGKRQHMPLRTRMYYDEPQGSGPGSLVIRGSLPGCSVGKRYGGMQFASGNKRYELTDAVISNCGAGAVTFAYAKVKVRGWDPEKKEL